MRRDTHSGPSDRRPRGFTQVEVLVTIIVIGTLASLYLPMITRARDAARGSQCKDHLHNLIIGVSGYLNTHGAYPAGAISATRPVRSVPGGYGIGWEALLLPYIEQRPLSDLIDFNQPLDADDYATLQSIEIQVYLCPAELAVRDHSVNSTSYAGCHHPVELPIDFDNRGAFVLNRGLDARDFPDGLSHTLLIGEKELGRDDPGWWTGTRATLRNTGTPLASLRSSPTDAPPDLSIDDPLAVGGFGSLHRWGVHFALGDGSVRIIRFETDLTLLQRLADRRDRELARIPTPE